MTQVSSSALWDRAQHTDAASNHLVNGAERSLGMTSWPASLMGGLEIMVTRDCSNRDR